MGKTPDIMGRGLGPWADAQLEYIRKVSERAADLIRHEKKGLKCLEKDDIKELFKGEPMRMSQVDGVEENAHISKSLKEQLVKKAQVKMLKSGQPPVSQEDVRRLTGPSEDQYYCLAGKTKCDHHVISDDDIAAHGCRAAGPHQSVPQVTEQWERCPVMNKIIFTEDQFQSAYKEFHAQLDKGMTNLMAGRIFCAVCKKHFIPKGEKDVGENRQGSEKVCSTPLPEGEQPDTAGPDS